MANQVTAQQVQEKARLTPAQRNLLFAQAARQVVQTLPAQAGAENATVSFTVPKARLLSKISLLVKATITVAHAANNTFAQAAMAPYNFIKNVRVEINNGFAPYRVSGIGAYLMNLLRDNAAQLSPAASNATRARTVFENAASAAGAANVLRFILDLPIALNDRDPVGLILAQNQETTVTVSVDFDDADVLLSSLTGYTVTASNVSVTPIIETFSIPPVPEALPDLSILKLTQELNEITVAGGHVLRLPVGQTYRRMVLYFTDANGNPLGEADLTGNIEITLNQADIPYVVDPYALAAQNQVAYGAALPKGVWAFDFATQGLPNYGGSRDYIDTERLTEFWLKLYYGAAGKAKVVYETLSRLR